MQFTAKEIARKLGGTVEGDENVMIYKPCRIEEVDEHGITFLANPKYTHYIYERKAAAILIAKDFVLEHPVDATLIRVDNPYICVARVLHLFNSANGPKRGRSWRSSVHCSARVGKGCYIGDFAVVGKKAKIGKNVQIYPQVYVGDYCEVGDNTILYPGAKIYRECKVGANCILHAGVVVGGDGFGFAPTDDGSYSKIDQLGNVVIEDDVEIGANTCIDRATMGSTVIHQNVKLDNLIQIAHNVEIGEGSAFAAQVGIAGSAKVGKHCIMGGQSAVAGHIALGDKIMVGAKAGVTHSLQGGQIVLGQPAIPFNEEKRLIIYRKKLPELYKRVSELEKKLSEK